jgi:beta-glucanase (GH16 family)
MRCHSVRLLITVLALAAASMSTAVAGTFGVGGYASPESYPGMDRAWRDEFSGTVLDAANWTGEPGYGDDPEELQYFQEANARLDDGLLVIAARREASGGKDYTSSRIVSRGAGVIEFGRVDVRARMPSGQGARASIRLKSSPRADDVHRTGGEIVIVEVEGGPELGNTAQGTLRWRSRNGEHFEGGSITLPADAFDDQFHIFSIEWDENRIQWLVDDIAYYESDISRPGMEVFRSPFHFVIELGVGGASAGAPDASTTFPQHLLVDYIRAFR